MKPPKRTSHDRNAYPFPSRGQSKNLGFDADCRRRTPRGFEELPEKIVAESAPTQRAHCTGLATCSANAEQLADALANRARIRTGADLRPRCLHVLCLSYARSSLLPNGTPSTLMPAASTSERSAGSSPARSARPGQRTTPSDAPPERRSRCHVHADTDTELGRAPSDLQLGDPRVHRPSDRSASPGQSSRRPATPRAPWQPNPGDL